MISFEIERRCVNENGIAIEYVLKKEIIDATAVYSIEIASSGNNAHTSYKIRDIARSDASAKRLLKLLADNAVCPTSAPFVIDDLAASMTFC